MSDVAEITCPNAELRKKTLWCKAINNYCGHQRHCPVRGRAILTDQAKACPVKNRENKP